MRDTMMDTVGRERARNPALIFLVAMILGAAGLQACAAGEPGPEAGGSAPEPSDYSNTIKWATASEVENFGYDVYRGESPDGPFERLTEDPIAGAGTSDEPHYYRFVDDDLDPTKEYWYYVESLSTGSVRERFTPVQRVEAKIPPDGASEP